MKRAARNVSHAALAMLAAGSGMATAGAAGRVEAAPGVSCCAVVELRQYALQPQRFDPFARLFEREFIEPQEAAGITVIGQFRNLDDPDRFVWLRGFADMPSRARALETFYGGALWKSLRDEANANFVDTDNVLLLRPASAAPVTGRGSGDQRPRSQCRLSVSCSGIPLSSCRAGCPGIPGVAFYARVPLECRPERSNINFLIDRRTARIGDDGQKVGVGNGTRGCQLCDF